MSNFMTRRTALGLEAPTVARLSAVEFARVYRASLLRTGLAGSLLIVPVSAIAALRARHHSLLSDTVSDLAAQDAPHANFMRVGLILFGVCVLALAAGLALSVPRYGTPLWITLSILGTCIMFAGVFQDYSEMPAAPRNYEGYLHNAFSLAAIGGLIASMVITVVVASTFTEFRTMLPVTALTVVVISICGAVFTWGSERYEGMAELVLYGSALVWLTTTSRFALLNDLSTSTETEGVPMAPVADPAGAIANSQIRLSPRINEIR